MTNGGIFQKTAGHFLLQQQLHLAYPHDKDMCKHSKMDQSSVHICQTVAQTFAEENVLLIVCIVLKYLICRISFTMYISPSSKALLRVYGRFSFKYQFLICIHLQLVVFK